MTIQRVNGADKGSGRSNSSNCSTPFFIFPRVHDACTREERVSEKRFERSAAVERLERFEPTLRRSAIAGENRRQLFGWNEFELVIRAIARLLVHAPPAKLRGVTEATALHVVVSDFDD
jgi:hypothetical protein